jgi:4'-phosphopantetheinyl transferase
MNITNCDFEFQPHTPLPENEVHLWRVDLDSLRESESRWQNILSADESARASRFRFAIDRQRFVISRGLLRTILGGYLAADPGSLTFSYSSKDKPSVARPDSESAVCFNVSHSGAVVLLAFTRGHDVGVDVEQIRSDFDVAAIARRFFSPHEQEQLAVLAKEKSFEAFFRCWTRKEAYIKATGDGLSLPLTQFDVSIEAHDKDALLATRPDATEAGFWSLREVPAGEGYVAALCVRGRDWKLRDWTSGRSESL